MLSNVEIISIAVALVGGCYLLGAFGWSIVFPDRRVWPPKKATLGVKVRVWCATTAIFVATFVLGLADWNGLEWPIVVRWGIGLPLIVVGNIVVWVGVKQIGLSATSGEVDELKTDGVYAYSRNPQYVADMGILLGWAILSSSVWAVIIAGFGIFILATAPFAEEPWLEEVYGQSYRDYLTRVRRYF